MLTQFSLLAILWLGALILRSGEPINDHWYRRGFGLSIAGLVWLTILIAVATLGALLLSDPYSATWQPLFGGLHLPTIRSAVALPLTFVVDILGVSALMGQTGGSRESPFTSVLSAIPTLAIFLREPFDNVFLYSTLVVACFTLLLVTHGELYRGHGHENESKRAATVAFWCVTFTTLALTISIAYVTR